MQGRLPRAFAWIVSSGLVSIAAALGSVPELNPVQARPHVPAASVEHRFIIKFRAAAPDGRQGAGHSTAADDRTISQRSRERLTALTFRNGLELRSARTITEHLHTVHVHTQTAGEPEAVLARLRADSEVAYAQLDERRYIHATPNDPLFGSGQWYLQQSQIATPTPSAVDAVTAWDTTPGSTGVVIADLDTGVRYEHPDLQWAGSGGRLLPGRNFVSNLFIANDGDGWDADASDPGDWITSSDLKQSQCSNQKNTANSSWHGTRTAGILGALSNNSVGIAGVTWNGWILPVRVLGKCGGYDSDIVSGMLWAAGIHVNGVPDNPYPARIENLSLGGTGDCSQNAAYLDAVNQLSARGVLVVASAGNEGGPVDLPANCVGVVGVGGLRHAGTKVGYSSLGPQLTVSAPAGNCVDTTGATCLYPITTTTNSGTQGPAGSTYTDNGANPNLGTSFSAPIVSGIAALMLSANGNLNTAQLIARLREAAQPFPQVSSTTTTMCHVPASASDIQNQECICSNDGQTCGAGMASASGSVHAALRPVAALKVPASVSAGATVSLDASGSAAACNHSVASYSWASSDPVNHPVTNSSGTTTAVTAPSTGQISVTLTVTDDAGKQDSATVSISASAAITSAPPSAGTHPCLAAITVPSPVSVSISPTSATLTGSATQAFTAVVSDTLNTGVLWQVNGIAGGNASVGTISSSGLYTAPATAPSPPAVTIVAVSAADASKSAAAQVSFQPIAAPPTGHSGGGGALDWATLLALGALRVGAALRRYRPAANFSAVSSQLRCALR